MLVGCWPKASSTSASRAAASTAVSPACVVRPELTEGPYFVDEQLDRADIRSDPATGAVKEGVPLQLALRVSQVGQNACTPLANAVVDVWHCDALGVYSDVADPHFNTTGQKFLRGSQTTDSTGRVQFLTIYPGWYPGRTVHIHFKIRTLAESGRYEFTSQLFFDDAITDRVYAQSPYASKGERSLRNDQDGIFQQGGSQLLLPLTSSAQGFAAAFEIGLDMA